MQKLLLVEFEKCKFDFCECLCSLYVILAMLKLSLLLVSLNKLKD